MGCNSSRMPKLGALDRDLAIKKARMDHLFDSIEKEGPAGDMKRLALGLMSGESTDNPGALAKATEYFIYGAIGRRPTGKNGFFLDDVEIARVEAILYNASTTASRAMKMGQKLVKEYGSVEKIPRDKLDHLGKFWEARGPFTMELAHSHNLVGGGNLFNELVMTESEHKAKRKSAEVEISNIVESMKVLSKEKFRSDSRAISVIDQEVRLLGDQYRMTEEAINAGDMKSRAKLDKLQAKINSANQKRARMYSDDDNTNRTALVNRAVIEIIEAKAKGGTNGALAKAKEFERNTGLDAEALGGLIGPVEKLFKDYVGLGEESVRYMKRLIAVEMERVGGSDVEIKEALDLVKPMGVFNEGFFPVQSLMNARPIEAVSLLKNMIDAIQYQGMTRPVDVLATIRTTSEHMETRTNSVEKENRDMNVASVLQHYTSTMLHTNYVIKSQFIFGNYVKSLYKIGMESGNVDAQAYAIAADRMLDFTRRRMVGTQSHGVMHELSSHVLSYAVLTKLGVFRPAGMARNWVEGRAMILAKIGIHNARRANKLLAEATETASVVEDKEGKKETYSTIVDSIMAEHKMDLGHESHVGEGPQGTLLTPKIKAIVDDPELSSTYLTVERIRSETHTHVFKQIDNYIQSQASRVKLNREELMSNWSAVETSLRRKAFRTGAVLAMDRANTVWGPLFNSTAAPIPKALIDKYDLDASKLDGRKENVKYRQEQLNRLMRKEGTRGGLSLLYKTQGQYSILSRHPIEDFSPFGIHLGKMMHLFRQYPDSWNTQFALGAREMHAAYRASGFKEGLLKTTQAEKEAGYQWYLGGQPALAAMIAMSAMLGLGAYLQNNKFGGIFGTGLRIAGLFRGDIPAVATALYGLANKDEKTQKWANGGRSLTSIFTGPLASPVEWTMNMAAISTGFQRGDLPLGVNTAAQALGWNPDKEIQGLPEDYDPKDFGDMAKATGDHWLHGMSFASDIIALRDEYNKDSKSKGMAVFLAFLKKASGAKEVYTPTGNLNKP